MINKQYVYTIDLGYCRLVLFIGLSLLLSLSESFAQAHLSSSKTEQATQKKLPVKMGVVTSTSPTKTAARLKVILNPKEKKTVTEALDAILLLIVEDLRTLHHSHVDPLAIRRVVPKAPLSSNLADWAELRLSTLIHQETSLTLKECISCKSQKTTIADGQFIITQGNLGSLKQGSQGHIDQLISSYLELEIIWDSDHQYLIVRARLQSPIRQTLWSEQYRSGDRGELAKRGLKNLQTETSIKTYNDLAKPPPMEHLDIVEILLGYGARQGQGLFGPVYRFGLGYGSFFGYNHQYLLLFQGNYSASISGTTFLDINADFRLRLSNSYVRDFKTQVKKQARQASQGLWMKAAFGVPFSPDIAGLLIDIGAHYMSKYRVGMGVSAGYAFRFQQGPDLSEPGGVHFDINCIINF